VGGAEAHLVLADAAPQLRTRQARQRAVHHSAEQRAAPPRRRFGLGRRHRRLRRGARHRIFRPGRATQVRCGHGERSDEVAPGWG